MTKIHNVEAAKLHLRTWVSVKDRLPQKGENGFPMVIVHTKAGEVAVGFLDYHDYHGDKWCVLHDYTDGVEFSDNVTHWMPLPEPPKEGRKEWLTAPTAAQRLMRRKTMREFIDKTELLRKITENKLMAREPTAKRIVEIIHDLTVFVEYGAKEEKNE